MIKEKLAYISWTAILSGAFIGVGLNFLFNLLALGLAISSFSIQAPGQTQVSIGGFLFFCISALIAMFTTGFVAGKLSPRVFINRLWGAFIGFLSWCLLLMITIILITNLIQYAAFHSNFTTSLVSVKLTNDRPMQTETYFHKVQQSPLSFNIETHKKEIVLNAYLTFLLFFIGGISSGIGGVLGYRRPPQVDTRYEQ